MAYVASADLVAGVLAGEVRAIARMLSRAEGGAAEARPALDAMFRYAGRAHVVGITGVPGSGKSTLVALLAAAIRRSSRKVGIVAIDPSSPFSGGAILGDRIRMGELGGDPGVYVRSMATRGALGGLARGALEAVDVLDAAGYDVVLIETVGVGQDEVDVARAAHTTVVVSAPGLGDDIQAIKAGILEIADIHVVSKCDRPDANKTIAELKSMLAMALGSEPSHLRGESGARVSPPSKCDSFDPKAAWLPPVIATSVVRDQGVADLVAAIDGHREALAASGEIRTRRALIAERRLLMAGEEILRDQFARHRHGKVSPLLGQLESRTLSPHAAAIRLLRELNLGGQS
jgi:LAO/AO transport system kinase